jgi:hypothetical protein
MSTLNAITQRQGNSRCCSIENSKTRIAIKMSAGIVAALAAIALVGCVFLAVAQQGYPLGGLNSIAQLAAAHWIYVGIAAAGAILIASIFTLALVRRGQDETLSSKGRDENLGLDTANNDSVAPQMPDNPNSRVMPVTQDQAPIQDKDTGGVVDLQENESDEYSEELVKAYFEESVQLIAANLPIGCYYFDCWILPNTNQRVEILGVNLNGTPEFHYFKFGKTLPFFNTHNFSSLVDISEICKVTQDIEQNYSIDKILSADNDFWLEKDVEVKGKKFDLIFLRENGQILKRILETGKGGEFNKDKNYNDAKTTFEGSLEYPEELGKFFVEKKGLSEEEFKKRAEKLFNNEYWWFKELQISSGAYKKVSRMITKDEKNGVKYHYFKSAKEADKFLKNDENKFCTDGYRRNRRAEILVSFAGSAFLKNQVQEKSLYKIVEQKEGLTHVVTFKYDNAEKKYTTASFYLQSDKISGLENGDQLTTEMLSHVPLSTCERTFLEEELKKNSAHWDQQLAEKKYVITTYANDSALIYVRDQANGQLVIDDPAYRIGSAAFQAALDKLHRSGYTPIEQPRT